MNHNLHVHASIFKNSGEQLLGGGSPISLEILMVDGRKVLIMISLGQTSEFR